MIGAIFSVPASSSGLGSDLTGAAYGLARVAWAGADFAAPGFGAGFCVFTVTFDVAGVGFGLGGGRAAFLATATLRVAFLGIALPGFLAALFGLFEGIADSALNERARDYTHALRPVQAVEATSINFI
ncbi:MAG: hypothetical protein ACLP2F_10950 [Steroidobacteraceae bacterium]